MMERLGHTMAGALRVYGWHALVTWARHLPQDSATWRAKHPDEAAFASAYGRATIAADTFDAIMCSVVSLARAHGARVRDPKPYPRPSDKADIRHYGSGGIPVADFESWYYAKD